MGREQFMVVVLAFVSVSGVSSTESGSGDPTLSCFSVTPDLSQPAATATSVSPTLTSGNSISSSSSSSSSSPVSSTPVTPFLSTSVGPSMTSDSSSSTFVSLTSVTTGSSSPPTTASGFMFTQIVYLGIAAGAVLIIIILFFICVFCMVCCCCNKSGGKTSRKKKGKIPDDSMAQWTEEGRVQLLSIAEKAGVEDPKNKPEKDEETDMADGATAPAPAAVTEPAPAEEDVDAKEDDKRVVTVATFGFPEVSIQPSSQAEGEDGEAGEAKDKESEIAKGESKPSDSIQPAGSKSDVATSETSFPAESRITPGPSSTDGGGIQAQPVEAQDPTSSSPGVSVQPQSDLIPPEVEVPGSSMVQKQEIDLQLDLGIESSILSTEAIEKALGIIT